MRKLLWIALLGLLIPAVGRAQGICLDTTITATGRAAINTPFGVYSFPSASFTYRTTGSPTGVSIAIEASNYSDATETPITQIAAVTTTSGNVDMGNTARPFRNWYANTATLSGGTSPAIVLTACWNYSAFTIAEFFTVPTFPDQGANVFFSGPASGADATPTFRAQVLADLPVGTANQYLKTNAGATSLEHVTLSGSANELDITHGVGTTEIGLVAAPVITTSLTSPLFLGGAAVGSTLSLRSTSGVGTTDAILFQVGSNGATEAGRFNTSGFLGIRDTDPSTPLSIGGTGSANGITLGDNAADPVNLYRSAANQMATDDDFLVGNTASNGALLRLERRNAATSNILQSAVENDTFGRLTIRADGRIDIGPGNAVRDTNLYRSAANTLKTDDRLALANFAAFADQAATPSVAAGNLFTVTNSLATTITAFLNGVNGQIITLIFRDANTTVTDGGTIFLQGASNFTSTADDTMQLVFDGTNWHELSRSVN